jgi:hypothetical protein
MPEAPRVLADGSAIVPGVCPFCEGAVDLSLRRNKVFCSGLCRTRWWARYKKALLAEGLAALQRAETILTTLGPRR